MFGAGVASANSITAQYQVNLDFVTSFNGSDRLTAELEAGNATALISTPTGESPFGNQLDLAYTTETQNQLNVGSFRVYLSTQRQY